MPLGGESVGSAYVRIYADGSDVPDGIRRALKDSEPAVREAGDRHGGIYSKAVDERLKGTGAFKKHFTTTQQEMFGDINENLTRQLAKLELSERFFQSRDWDRFVRRLERESGAAGVLAAKNLQDEFRTHGNLDRLAAEMLNFGPRITAARAQINAERIAEQDRIYDELLRQQADFNRDQARLLAEHDMDFERSTRNNQRAVESLWNSMEAINDSLEKIHRGQESAFGRGDIRRILNELDATMQRVDTNIDGNSRNLRDWQLEIARSRSELDSLTPTLSRLSGQIDRSSNTIGRLFGRGSRNDFLNFFGGVVGGLLRITRLIPDTLGWFTRLGRGAVSAFGAGGGGITGLLSAMNSVMTAVAGTLITATVAGAGFVAFLGLLSLAIGPIVGILSSLVGVLVALTSTVAFGLVGAFAGFLPLIVPIAGIIGGIVVAVNRFKDNAGPLAGLFETLEDRSRRWLDVFSDRAFANIEKYGDRVDEATRGLSPLFDAAGRGFNRFMNEVTSGLDSPGFRAFVDEFTEFLPDAMRDLGEIARGALGGIGGILRGAIPSAETLLDNLVDLTTRFSEWANSPSGQNEIKRFLEEAGESAEALGEFLADAWDWLNSLLSSSRDTGDTIFSNMADDFERWANFIDENPDVLEQWMKDAEQFAQDIGEIIEGINRLIDTLDTASTRAQGSTLLSGFAAGLQAISGALNLFQYGTGIGLISTIIDQLWGVWDEVEAWGDGVRERGAQLGRDVWYVLGGEWMGDLMEGIGDAVSGIDLGGIFDSIRDSLGSFGSGGGGAMTITPQFNPNAIIAGINRLPGLLRSGANRAVEPFRGLAGRIAGAAGPIASRVASLAAGLPGRLAGFANRGAASFGGLASRAAGAAGNIAQRVAARAQALPGQIGGIVDRAVAPFRPFASRVSQAIGNLWGAVQARFSSLVEGARAIPGQIVGFFAGLGGRIAGAIGTIAITMAQVSLPNIPGVDEPWNASGAIYNKPTRIGVGEDGPEAIVPLDRDLGRVDPAVRALSAYAQGIEGFGPSDGKTIDASGWQIVTPSRDPAIVAQEVLDSLVTKLL